MIARIHVGLEPLPPTPEATAEPVVTAGSLTIAGAVGSETSLAEADLRAMEVVQRTVEHPKKGTQTYEGVSLNALLDLAGIEDGTTTLVITASDGFSTEVSLAEVRACADCLVAFTDTAETFTHGHARPVQQRLGQGRRAAGSEVAPSGLPARRPHGHAGSTGDDASSRRRGLASTSRLAGAASRRAKPPPIHAARWPCPVSSSPVALVSEAPDGSRERTPVVVFAAGSLILPFMELEQAFEERHPEIDVQAEYHGSIQVMRHVTELHEEIDVVATADAALIPMLMYASSVPETGQPYAEWYIRFASNRLALAYTPRSLYADEIQPENWHAILAQAGRETRAGRPALRCLRLPDADGLLADGESARALRSVRAGLRWAVHIPGDDLPRRGSDHHHGARDPGDKSGCAHRPARREHHADRPARIRRPRLRLRVRERHPPARAGDAFPARSGEHGRGRVRACATKPYRSTWTSSASPRSSRSSAASGSATASPSRPMRRTGTRPPCSSPSCSARKDAPSWRRTTIRCLTPSRRMAMRTMPVSLQALCVPAE